MCDIRALDRVFPDWLKSPLIVYSWCKPKNQFFLFEVYNQIGERFLLIKKQDEKVFADIKRDIEIAKYPLAENELQAIFDKIRLQLSVNGKSYRMQYRDADMLFHSLGIYYRLGLLNYHDADRYNILRAYSRLYGFKLTLNDWTVLELKEFQRFADLGYSLVDISKIMNRSYTELRQAVEKHNIIVARKKRVYQHWKEEEYDILRQYVGVKTFNEIQKNYLPHRKLRDLIVAATRIGLSTKRGEL